MSWGIVYSLRLGLSDSGRLPFRLLYNTLPFPRRSSKFKRNWDRNWNLGRQLVFWCFGHLRRSSHSQCSRDIDAPRWLVGVEIRRTQATIMLVLRSSYHAEFMLGGRLYFAISRVLNFRGFARVRDGVAAAREEGDRFAGGRFSIMTMQNVRGAQSRCEFEVGGETLLMVVCRICFRYR